MFGKLLSFNSLWKQSAGNVAVITALTAPVAVGLAGGTVDYVNSTREKSRMQAIVDAAAIAAAREVSLANTDNNQIAEVARVTADDTVKVTGDNIATSGLSVVVSDDRSTIDVSLTTELKSVFGGFFAGESKNISAFATANILGSGNICVMALNPVKPRSVLLTASARLSAEKCGIFSSSTHRRSMVLRNNAIMKAAFICSAGGARSMAGAQMTPTAVTDCPSPPDPLAARPKPDVGACDHTDLVLKRFNGTLSPGVYCGGLTLRNRSAPTLEEGTYIMKDGPLVVSTNSKLRGENVGFYLTGTNASFKFHKRTEISLKAPVAGTMAGVLIFQDPEIPDVEKDDYEPTTNVITSRNAHTLEGTIYLPRGGLVVDGEDRVAANSAYTAIIVDRMRLREGPVLVLNSDYKSTSVPVPEGIAGGRVVLSK